MVSHLPRGHSGAGGRRVTGSCPRGLREAGNRSLNRVQSRVKGLEGRIPYLVSTSDCPQTTASCLLGRVLGRAWPPPMFSRPFWQAWLARLQGQGLDNLLD